MFNEKDNDDNVSQGAELSGKLLKEYGKRSSRSSFKTNFKSTTDDYNYIVIPQKYPDFITNYCRILKDLKQDDSMFISQILNSSDMVRLFIPICLRFSREINNTIVMEKTNFCEFILRHTHIFLQDMFRVKRQDLDTLFYYTPISELNEDDGSYPYYLVMVFPNITVTVDDLKSKIIKKYQESLDSQIVNSNEYLQDIYSELIDDEDDSIIYYEFFDNFPMYGSGKDVSTEKLDLYGIVPFDIINNNLKIYDRILDNHFSLKLTNLIPKSKHILYSEKKLSSDFFSEYINDISGLFPFLFDIKFILTELTEIKKKVADKSTVEEEHIEFSNPDEEFINIDEESFFTSLKLANKFLNMISNSYFNNRREWIIIGKSLYSIGKLSESEEESLNLWANQTSKRPFPKWCKKYDSVNFKELCSTKFIKFRNLEKNTYGMRDLALMAKRSNDDEYDDWETTWVCHCIENMQYCTDINIAKLCFRFYNLRYINSGVGCKWFEFNNYSLEEITINKLIPVLTGDFFKRLTSLLCIYEQSNKTINMPQRRIMGKTTNEKSIYSILPEIIKFIQNLPSIKRVVESMAFMFSSHIDDLDFNHNCHFNLFAVGNAVFDFGNKHTTTRLGYIGDYITKRSNVQYNSGFSEKHPHVILINTWIYQLFCDKETSEHFKKVLASFLYSGNKDKLIYIFSGPKSNNSKTSFMNILRKVLNETCSEQKAEYYTERNFDADKPSPSTYRVHGTKLAITPELSASRPIQNDIIKKISGGEKLQYRRMRSDTVITFTPSFKSLFSLNSPAFFSEDVDMAIYNRMCVYPFDSIWSDNFPKDKEEQYKLRIFERKDDFERHCEIYASALLWIMINYYPIYRAEGVRKFPEAMIKKKEEYFNSIDIVQCFINKCLVKSEKGKIIEDRLFEKFKEWVEKNFPGKRPMTSIAFEISVKRILGESSYNKEKTGGIWIGIKFTTKK